MVGSPGYEDGRKAPYYACVKRMRTKDCDRSYVTSTNGEKKHLLHRMVEEVRVHDRVTVEAFYAVPNPDAVRTLGRMARLSPQYANPIRTPEAPRTIRSWPIPTRRGRLRDPVRRGVSLQASGGQMVLTAPRSQDSDRHGPQWLPGHVRKALVWGALLAARAVQSRAEIARWQGISRARVTQVLSAGNRLDCSLN